MKELEEILDSKIDGFPSQKVVIEKLLAWRDKAVQEARIEITKKYLLAQGLPETANLLDAVHKELK